MWLPTVEQVMLVHDRLVRKTGGSFGLRDIRLVESAVMRASAGFGEIDLYPLAIQKAAAICAGLVCNHGFVDGNKRIGIVMLLMILEKNGIDLNYTQRELVDLGLYIAQGKMDVEDISNWVEAHGI